MGHPEVASTDPLEVASGVTVEDLEVIAAALEIVEASGVASGKIIVWSYY